MSKKDKIKLYIASPLTFVPMGGHVTVKEIQQIEKQRYQDASKVTSDILDYLPDIVPFSPVAYSYPLVKYCGTDVDWLAIDKELLEVCDWMLKLQLRGWERSKGMAYETEVADAAGIPILYAHPNEVIGLLKYNYDRYLEYGAI